MADDDNKEVTAPAEEDKKEDSPATEEKETPKPSLFSSLCGCFSKKPATESKEVPPADDKPAEPTEKADEQEKPEQAQPVTAE